jgi:septum formation protein
MTSEPRLVLASASPRRATILRQLGLSPDVQPADVDESYLLGEGPIAHVERLARAKAAVASERDPAVLVVAGDTVVVIDERVLSKPRDAEEAVAMLMSLAGRTHDVFTALALAGPHGTVSAVARAKVRFRSFSPDVALSYVATGEPLDKAGAYAIQGRAAGFAPRIDGSFSGIMGLPLAETVELLRKFQISVI